MPIESGLSCDTYPPCEGAYPLGDDPEVVEAGGWNFLLRAPSSWIGDFMRVELWVRTAEPVAGFEAFFTYDTWSLEFGIPGKGPVHLSVFDVTGREVRRPCSGEYQPSWDSVVWDGRGENGAAVSQGVYIARLRFGSGARTERMAIIR